MPGRAPAASASAPLAGRSAMLVAEPVKSDVSNNVTDLTGESNGIKTYFSVSPKEPSQH